MPHHVPHAAVVLWSLDGRPAGLDAQRKSLVVVMRQEAEWSEVEHDSKPAPHPYSAVDNATCAMWVHACMHSGGSIELPPPPQDQVPGQPSWTG